MTLKTARKAARQSKGLNSDDRMSREKVVVYANGDVQTTDPGSLTRGEEYPILTLRTPHTVAQVLEMAEGK